MQIHKSHYSIGKITQPHGLKGHVLVYVFSESYDWLDDVDGFYLESGKFLEIDKVQPYKKGLRVLFKGITNRNLAEELKQEKLYIDKALLSSKPGEDIYFNEIQGFMVKDETLGELGQVKTFEHHPGNDLLVIQYNQKECLIPFVPELIVSIDFESQVIVMNLPEGLLDL